MKIRNGFVTNSSSTSYCIYGTWVEYNDMAEFNKKMSKFILEDDIVADFNLLSNELGSILNEPCFEIIKDDSDNYYIGFYLEGILRSHADMTWTQLTEYMNNKLRTLELSNGEIMYGEVST